MTNLTNTIVQAFYTRCEEYVSIGTSEDDSALLASQELAVWLEEGRFGQLSSDELGEAIAALTRTRLYIS